MVQSDGANLCDEGFPARVCPYRPHLGALRCGTAEPPSARSLAAEIPGCKDITVRAPAAMELEDVTCNLGVQVDLATFADARDEQRWIDDGGSPASPDRRYQGCCIQGSLWAATVDWSRYKAEIGGASFEAGDATAVDFDVIRASIGGHQVNSTVWSH